MDKLSIKELWENLINRFKSLFHTVRWYDDGAIDIGREDTDFTVGDEWAITKDEIKNLPTIKIAKHAYNQKQRDWSSCCTIFSAFTVISNIMDYKFSDREIEEMIQLAETKWYVRLKWWATKKGVETAVEYWNKKYPSKKVLYFVDMHGSDVFLELTKKWYPYSSTIRWDSEWSRDRSDNWWVDGVSFLKKRGHALCWYSEFWCRKLDSYNWYRSRYNDYGVSNPEKLLNNWNMYYPVYFIIQEKDILNDTNIELKANIDEILKFNSDMWNKTKDSKLRNYLNISNNQLRKYKNKL